MAKQKRLALHEKLVDILGSDNVYYQPPENVKLSYPCIIYELAAGSNHFADNRSYMYHDCYTIKYINRDPDTDMPDRFRETFTYISRGSRYKADNLYHDIFTIYV